METLLTLKQHAYNFIQERLLSGAVLPGSRLSDDSIAKEIGVSRSPVREAISQLANEGLVELNPRKGAFVCTPSREQMRQAYEARLALEGFVAGRAAEVATDRNVDDLEKINDRLLATAKACQQRPSKTADKKLIERFMRADLEFHEKILSIVGNQKINEMVQKCKLLTSVFGQISMEHDLGLIARTYRQHSLILRAIRRRDPQLAIKAMNEHIEKSAKVVIENFKS